MPDYQKTMIYKLVCNEDPTFLYVGHTTNWKGRKKAHKEKCDHAKHRKLYQHIDALGGWNNIKMIWIEDYPCNTKREAEAREQQFMDELKSNMNTYRAYCTAEQRKKRDLENKKEYYKENKESLTEKHKEYRENNKEKCNKQSREYYQDNKESLAEKYKKTFECECGSTLRIHDRARHFKTKKHQAWLNTCHTVEN